MIKVVCAGFTTSLVYALIFVIANGAVSTAQTHLIAYCGALTFQFFLLNQIVFYDPLSSVWRRGRRFVTQAVFIATASSLVGPSVIGSELIDGIEQEVAWEIFVYVAIISFFNILFYCGYTFKASR